MKRQLSSTILPSGWAWRAVGRGCGGGVWARLNAARMLGRGRQPIRAWCDLRDQAGPEIAQEPALDRAERDTRHQRNKLPDRHRLGLAVDQFLQDADFRRRIARSAMVATRPKAFWSTRTLLSVAIVAIGLGPTQGPASTWTPSSAAMNTRSNISAFGETGTKGRRVHRCHDGPDGGASPCGSGADPLPIIFKKMQQYQRINDCPTALYQCRMPSQISCAVSANQKSL